MTGVHQRSIVHYALENEPAILADDTCLLVKHLIPEQLKINLNAGLHHLHLWCSVNKLSFNSATTNIVFIHLNELKRQCPN